MIIQKNPKLSEHHINYYTGRKQNVPDDFKGFLEVPVDSYTYYSVTADDKSCMYLPVSFRINSRDMDDTNQLKNFIEHQQREFNRNNVSNEYYSKEDIKELYFPDINMDTYIEDYPFVCYFTGCDDGSYYFRFRTEKERLEFFEECLTLETAADIFEIQRENLIVLASN